MRVDLAALASALPFLMTGLWFTLQITIVGVTGGIIFGSLLAVAPLSRDVLPILLTQTIILFQDTSLVYVISATDLLGAATKIAQRDGRLVEMYLTVGVIYFILCYAASQLVKQLQGRLSYGAR